MENHLPRVEDVEGEFQQHQADHREDGQGNAGFDQ
jgi:hypothetical protein